jgi:hypothetical protein
MNRIRSTSVAIASIILLGACARGDRPALLLVRVEMRREGAARPARPGVALRPDRDAPS